MGAKMVMTQNVEGKTKTTHMRIPRSLKEEIKREAERRGISMWQVLVEWASAFYDIRRGKTPRADADKIAWYIYKLSASVGEFRASPTAENKQATLETLQQVKERLGVATDELELAIKSYDGTHAKKKTLNDAAKLIVLRILEKSQEEEAKVA
jgi:hypothetical protein